MKTIILFLAMYTTASEAYRPIPDNQKITPLLNGKRELTSLTIIEKLGLNQAQTNVAIWSGHYWPHFQGSLGARYRDPAFIELMNQTKDYSKYKEFQDDHPLSHYSGQESILSPSEKYDLLVGDHEMSLTKYSWGLGDKSSTFRSVPTWRGICDGWSSASQIMPRPERSVTFKSPMGISLKFYPEDIKALGSLAYSRNQENVIFLGKRCSTVLGVFRANCQGTNSGAFHKALINRVGLLKKTFIADVSPGLEVWNYPVKSYVSTYFNVFSKRESSDFRQVMERFEPKNRFQKHGRRHDDTYSIVGVKTVVAYINMRDANLLETDSTAQDSILEKTYYYDLELDVNHNILGGEWSQKDIPDFIWAPNDRTYPLSEVERQTTPRGPREILEAAQVASKDGQPLAIIIERLFEHSK